jgi:hypothetical protein
VPERLYATPLLDKLGVRPGARVGVVGLDEPWFLDLLAERTSDVTVGSALPDSDLAFLGANSTAELAALAALRPSIRPDGAIWIVSLKGRLATIRDVDVISAILAAGMVDNKVASFSDTQTSLRAVIRRRDRG